MTRMLGAHYIPAHMSLSLEHFETFDLLHFHDEVDLSFPTILLGVNKPKLFTLHSFGNTFRYYQTNRMARGMLLTLSYDNAHTRRHLYLRDHVKSRSSGYSHLDILEPDKHSYSGCRTLKRAQWKL